MTALSAASLNGPGTRAAVSSTIDAAQGGFPDDRLSAFAKAHAAASLGSRVLLVGDDFVFSLDIQRILRNAGYRVAGPVSSVAQAESQTSRGPLECAILDVDRWPDRAAAIADHLDRHGVPMVALSAYGTAPLPERYRHLPVVAKPVTESA